MFPGSQSDITCQLLSHAEPLQHFHVSACPLFFLVFVAPSSCLHIRAQASAAHCRFPEVQGRLQYPSCIPPLALSASRTSKTGRFHPASPTGRTLRGTLSPWTSGWQLMGEGCKRPPSMTALPSSLKPYIWQRAQPGKQVSLLSPCVSPCLLHSHCRKAGSVCPLVSIDCPGATLGVTTSARYCFGCSHVSPLVQLQALSADTTWR